MKKFLISALLVNLFVCSAYAQYADKNWDDIVQYLITYTEDEHFWENDISLGYYVLNAFKHENFDPVWELWASKAPKRSYKYLRTALVLNRHICTDKIRKYQYPNLYNIINED